MSGIYLIVWDEQHKEKSPVLKATKGGYPHITLAYTGDELKREQLIKTAGEVLAEWGLKKVTLQKAYVNSFSDHPNHMRHDVLVEVLDKESIEASRIRYLKDVYQNSDKFAMRNPHVTYGIYESLGEATEIARKLNEGKLPYHVLVTGVTID
jgi:hypothetical protein